MSEQSSEIQLRLARQDELSTILNWLEDPTLLAVTNTKRMSPETVLETKKVIKAKIANKSLWIIVRDNFRIGAVFSDSYSPNTDSSKYLTAQNSKSIYIYTKARHWELLSTTVTEVWRKQLLDSAYPISVMRSPLSGSDSVSNHNRLENTNHDSLEPEDDSFTSQSVQIKKIRILGPKSRNESIRKTLPTGL